MRGSPIVTAERPTVLDRPDHRVPEVRIPKLAAERVRMVTNREVATDPRLRAIDRCFERWARTPGDSGGPELAQAILSGASDTSGPPPLDDLESKIVDAAVRESPRWARTFVHLWYRTDSSPTEIAKMLCIKHRQYVYHERQIVLGYYLGRLTGAVQLHLTA